MEAIAIAKFSKCSKKSCLILQSLHSSTRLQDPTIRECYQEPYQVSIHIIFYSFIQIYLIIELYQDEDIQVHMEPLAKWCRADYVEKRVKHIKGETKTIVFEDESTLEYDILALNVGSRTRGANDIQGVWDHSLTTRPINELLGKI